MNKEAFTVFGSLRVFANFFSPSPILLFTPASAVNTLEGIVAY